MEKSISRRRFGLGVGAVGGATVLGSAGTAQAGEVAHGDVAKATPAGISSISSPPEAGVSYRFLNWVDSTPLNSLANGRIFGTNGVFASPQDLLGVAADLPPGAVVHDVEAYYQAQTNTTLSVAVWSSGAANLGNTIGSVQLGPFAGNQMHATRLVIASAGNGPFPHGCRLAVYIDTLPNSSIQVNGFRIGLKNAPLSPVLLASPARVYDSHVHGALKNRSRTISLASHIPPGANGAIVNVTASRTSRHGSLKVFAAGRSTPSAAAVTWYGKKQVVSNQTMTALDAARRVTVHATGSAEFTLDLIGYLV